MGLNNSPLEPEALTLRVEVKNSKRPGWTALTQQGCVGVEAKGLLRRDHLALAMLRFGKHATIHEHPADFDVDVICLEGEGFASVGGETVRISADQSMRWPADIPHRLWTSDSTMITLMVEHHRD
jgi:quercetin dioxygenase-like cupin family protein